MKWTISAALGAAIALEGSESRKRSALGAHKPPLTPPAD